MMVRVRFAVSAALAVALTVLAARECRAAPLPKSCLPMAQLHGRDTMQAYMPCNSVAVLPLTFRLAVECTLARMKKGGWDAMVYETWRSDHRQKFLFAYGRTRPGPKVTNARDALTTVHHYTLAVDIVHRTRLWNHPRFFYWLGQHAEACGLVAGAFWTRFPDQPHIQFGAWDGAPPMWARVMMASGNLAGVLVKVGAVNP